ncbi:Uncharacterised protein [Burkholderia pseudomallei]|nr:Uncharacterised protein [Burkholderia pseudomallei]VCA92968.1 Uncharacterised protein [Burkholderia pseudomallei]VCB14117.1 Uncharacterised protein [Burkholderia pseudomallei]VCB16065.1 Uncharacterised protein [Burkholderia pseudomallei]VCF09460.1 Uncharacterised protein [Burkholderia pseudomallei]
MIARPVASKVICSAIGSPCEPPLAGAPLAGAPHVARTRAASRRTGLPPS